MTGDRVPRAGYGYSRPSRARAPGQDLGIASLGQTDQPQPAGVSGRRQRHRWLLTGTLVGLSVLLTALFASTLAADLLQHHWARALDCSKDAVPAVVCWAAAAIALGGGLHGTTRTGATADMQPSTHRLMVAARNADSVRHAQQRVQKLTEWLTVLARQQGPASGTRVGLGTAEAEVNRRLTVQLAETRARLDRAQQWLASAQAAVEASRADSAAAEHSTLMHAGRPQPDLPSARPDRVA